MPLSPRKITVVKTPSPSKRKGGLSPATSPSKKPTSYKSPTSPQASKSPRKKSSPKKKACKDKRKCTALSPSQSSNLLIGKTDRCCEHISCPPFCFEDLNKVAKAAYKASTGLEDVIKEMNPSYLQIWWYGRGELNDLCVENYPNFDECCVCGALDILASECCFPFLCGLYINEEHELFERALAGLESLGENVEGHIEKVRFICQGK